jgi:hypothetical protein
VTTKRPAVKKYVIKLSEAERERLNTLIQKDKCLALEGGQLGMAW